MPSDDHVVLSPVYGRNEAIVLCLYCKKPKTVKAFGILHTERVADLFGDAELEYTGRIGEHTEFKAPATIIDDAIPCIGCEARREAGLSAILVAQLDRANRPTGRFLIMKGLAVKKYLKGEAARDAVSRGYHAASHELWTQMINGDKRLQ